ncbi:MAG: AraC family transcriptional regulator [Eubacteriales bacterium]|nr:AraC family transcriptional regulator [Eubacteriales bacterium]
MEQQANDLSKTRYTNSMSFHCLENLHETSMDLSLIHCGREQCHPLHSWHGRREEYIIHFVISGRGSFTVNGRTAEIGLGEMFLICPDQDVSYTADADDPWQYAWIGFDGMRAENIVQHCGFTPQQQTLEVSSLESILRCIDKILENRLQTFSNDLKRKSCLLDLLSRLVDQNTQRSSLRLESEKDTQSIYVHHAVEYIRAAYADGINVTDVANHVGISRTYLNNTFQKDLGISVQKFLIDFRLHRAANLLLSTTRLVSEISEAVGYDDPLAFSKSFKKKFGTSPRQYRELRQTLDQYHEKQ